MGLHLAGHNWLRAHGMDFHVEQGMTQVEGDIRIACASLERLPFRDLGRWSLSGTFDCSGNRLVTLSGAPSRVGGNFLCQGNLLSDLQGAPEWVGGKFNCALNRLFHLGGAPKFVGIDFDCQGNLLSSLEGLAGTVVHGDVILENNALVSLERAPRNCSLVGVDPLVAQWDRARQMLAALSD